MKKFLNNVLLVDGSYMLMRAMKQPGLAELRTHSGKLSGGVFGFLRMLTSTINKHVGYYPIVLWDKGRSPRRLELYPNYKRNADRVANPLIPGSGDDEFLQSLRDQRASVMDYLTSLRIPNIRIPDWEGDDLIYILSRSANKSMILSDDKDFIQLCDTNCKVCRPMADEMIEYETVDSFYKYPQYEYWKAIVGDGSDNIPKCLEGIGGKSAEKVAQVMSDFIKETGCNPHEYQVIFNYLKEAPLEEEWKSVRGLRNKIKDFLQKDPIDQFTLNMKLTDFNYVEIPSEMQSLIESHIIPVISKSPSIMEAYRILGKYEINELDPGQLMARLVGASSVLL